MSEVLDIYSKAPRSSTLLKAFANSDALKNVKMNDPKSAIIDPYGAQGVHSLRSKPTAIPYSTLRRIAQVPAIAAIINTRLNQVARFARRPRFDGDIGFKIVLKDAKSKMNDAQQKRAFEIEEFLLRTGAIPNARRKDNLDTFLRKVVRDTLTLDVMVWENVPNLKGGLAEIWAVDGATIELVANSPTGEALELPVYEPITKRGRTDAGNIAYVQKIDGQTIAEYTEAEITYAIRNPRTDVMLVDFGMSELETLIEIVTGIMNGVRYNTSYFSESHLPQGILSVIGKYKDEHLEAFKRHWKTLTSGAAGKWAVPVMATEDGTGVNFTPFKTSNRDMEFNEFLEFLFNIACAVYQIDPNEVGFKSWTSGNSMTASDNTEAKLDQSKDKGFIPLMQFLANTFNSEVIDRIDDEFALAWVGVDEEDEDKKMERTEKQINSGIKTVAMIWKENDVDIDEIKKDYGGELPKWALAPANAQLIQVFMSDIQAQQQQEQMAQQQQMQAQQSAIEGAQSGMDAEAQHQRQLEIMDKQHGQNIEAKKLDQAHQIKLADKQAQTQSAQIDQQHGNTLEAKKLDHKQQEKMVDKQAEVQSAQIDKQHGNNLEAKELDHKQQEKMVDKQAEVQSAQGKDQHGRDLEKMDKQHEQAKDMADHTYAQQKETAEDSHKKASEDGETAHRRGLQVKKLDQQHQLKVEALKARAKSQGGKLKKSLDYSEGDDLEITFEWDNY